MAHDEDDDFEPAPPLVYVLTIPDDLLAWVKQDDVAKTMPVPWGRRIERLMALSTDDQSLSTDDTESLLSALEAVSVAAISAGRQDLLLGFDTATASLLKLTFSFKSGDKTISIGRGQRWTFGEIALVQATDDPPGARAFVERVKDLVEGIFPGEVGAISRDTSTPRCRGCGGDPKVIVGFGDDVGQPVPEMDLCLSCWLSMYGSGRASLRSVPVPKKARGRKKAAEPVPEPEPVPELPDDDRDQLDLLGDQDWE